MWPFLYGLGTKSGVEYGQLDIPTLPVYQVKHPRGWNEARHQRLLREPEVAQQRAAAESHRRNPQPSRPHSGRDGLAARRADSSQQPSPAGGACHFRPRVPQGPVIGGGSPNGDISEWGGPPQIALGWATLWPRSVIRGTFIWYTERG